MKLRWKALIGALSVFLCQWAWGEPQGRVTFSQAGFISPSYQQTLKKDFQLISGGLDTLSDYRHEEDIDDNLQAQLRGVVVPGVAVMNYLNVSQLFWKQDLLTVGRKKVNWSALDEDYVFGIYQPVFKWNPLQWESQGLTGLFLHWETDEKLPWGLTLFGSPLFIPNQGSGFEVQDGVFQESNPYFHAPPARAFVNGQEFRVNYTIQKPRAEEVVLRQSFAGQVFVGSRDKEGYVQMSYAYKPMNELNLGFVGYAPPTNNQVNVEILPTVSQHSVASMDLQYTMAPFRVGVSGVRENPKDPVFEKEWTYATFTPSTLVSPFIEFSDKRAELRFSVLRVEGGESLGFGPDASQAMKFIPQRYPFRNAGLVSAKYQVRLKRQQSLALSTRYLRGEAGEFDLWLSQAVYQWRPGWAFTLVGQMVAVENTALGEKTAFNSYYDNDLLAVGVSYVF